MKWQFPDQKVPQCKRRQGGTATRKESQGPASYGKDHLEKPLGKKMGTDLQGQDKGASARQLFPTMETLKLKWRN